MERLVNHVTRELQDWQSVALTATRVCVFAEVAARYLYDTQIVFARARHSIQWRVCGLWRFCEMRCISLIPT